MLHWNKISMLLRFILICLVLIVLWYFRELTSGRWLLYICMLFVESIGMNGVCTQMYNVFKSNILKLSFHDIHQTSEVCYRPSDNKIYWDTIVCVILGLVTWFNINSGLQFSYSFVVQTIYWLSALYTVNMRVHSNYSH